MLVGLRNHTHGKFLQLCLGVFYLLSSAVCAGRTDAFIGYHEGRRCTDQQQDCAALQHAGFCVTAPYSVRSTCPGSCNLARCAKHDQGKVRSDPLSTQIPVIQSQNALNELQVHALHKGFATPNGTQVYAARFLDSKAAAQSHFRHTDYLGAFFSFGGATTATPAPSRAAHSV